MKNRNTFLTVKVLFITAFMLIFISINAYAGDTPEEIMSGKQKALFIGKIISINTDSCTVKPSTVMMGSIEKAEIQVKRFNNYYGTDDKPKTGDIIIAVLQDDNNIDKDWVLKCTSEDYKTLKLVSTPHEQYDIVTRYQKYINDGRYFEEQKKLNKSNNISAVTANAKVQNTDIGKNNHKENNNTINSIFIVLLILIIIGVILPIVIKFKKHNIN